MANRRDENRVTNISGVSSITFTGNIEPAVDTATRELLTKTTIPSVTHENTHTGNKELRVYQENHICTQNTTTTPLTGGATFTGEWQDCLNYQEVNVSVDTDQNSATNGLVIQWSADATVIADTDVFSVYANLGTNYTPNPAFRYVRVVYTNGATPQTRFNLMTILRRGVTGGSFYRIDSTLKDDSDGRLAIVVPKLKTAQNTYVSQNATTAGNAKVSLEEVDPSVVLPLPTGAATSALQTTANTYLSGIAGLTPTAYDYISLSYTGDNLTGVVFKSGGSGGTTIATLNLAYTGSRLDSVTKT